MSRTTEEVRVEFVKAIKETGVEVGPTGCITSPGRFEGQPVDIVYWYRALQEGGADDVGSRDDGSGFAIFIADEYESDMFDLDLFAERYAVLHRTSDGFYELEYGSEEETDVLLRRGD